jgi:hypothetical protein
MSIVDFQEHWRRHHGPTAGAIPNLRRYVQHHAVTDEGRLLLPYPGFDACSELDFESPEAMDHGFARAAAAGELEADEQRFVDKTRYSWLLGESDRRSASETSDHRSPPVVAVDTVTLTTWWRAHPASTPARLIDVLTGEWERACDPLPGRRLIAARPDWHAGRAAPSADVVEVIEFDGVEQALAFLAGPAAAAGPVLAGVAFGTERHLARPVVIVGTADESG